MSSEKKHASNQILRAYKLIEVLAGHELNPLRTSEVARGLGAPEPTATRHLQAAEAAGWAEKTPDGRWRCRAGKFTNMAIAIQSGIQRERNRFEDSANQLTRSAY